MSIVFNPQVGLIIVPVEIEGPSGSAILQLAFDTGATKTLINTGMLVALGYDPALSPNRIEITTGSGIEFVPEVILHRMMAFDNERTFFPVLCHTLPPSAGVDGLLGLDFVRSKVLTIDFAAGIISVNEN